MPYATTTGACSRSRCRIGLSAATVAIFVQSSSITDYPAIARTMVKEIRRRGGTVLCGVEVVGIKERPTEVTVETTEGEFKTEFVTVCAGLHADRMAAMCGIDLDFRIVPFRGEYFRLPDSKNEIVKHLIYPVPDPKLPFLGVHLTPMIGGYVTVGPNAVLAMAREGYRRSAVDLKEVAGLLAFPGFWRVMRNHAGSAVTELKNSLWRRGYLAECRKFCPELTLDDLSSYPAGVAPRPCCAMAPWCTTSLSGGRNGRSMSATRRRPPRRRPSRSRLTWSTR